LAAAAALFPDSFFAGIVAAVVEDSPLLFDGSPVPFDDSPLHLSVSDPFDCPLVPLDAVPEDDRWSVE